MSLFIQGNIYIFIIDKYGLSLGGNVMLYVCLSVFVFVCINKLHFYFKNNHLLFKVIKRIQLVFLNLKC